MMIPAGPSIQSPELNGLKWLKTAVTGPFAAAAAG
jgi:hypothetical protein